ncbi:MAG: hypothetical protein ACPGQL_05740 [Thermoplasmatota archaeon]
MALTTGHSINLFVGFVLAALTLILIAGVRRSRDTLWLAAFLSLVTVNFLSWGLPGFNGTTRAVVAAASLALDPFFLLTFTALRTRQTHHPGVAFLMGASGAVALAAVVLMLFDPSLALAGGWDWQSPVTVAINVNLAVCYTVSWLLAVAAHRDATPDDVVRAGWLALALGVAVVPRMALLPADLQWLRFLGNGLGLDEWDNFIRNGASLVGAPFLMLLWLAWGRHLAGGRSAPQHVRRMLRDTSLLVFSLYLLNLLLWLWQFAGGPEFAIAGSYGLRWIAFAAILVHGSLTYGLTELNPVTDRFATLLGALVGSGVTFLSLLGPLEAAGYDTVRVAALAALAAVVASVPAAWLLRAAVRQFQDDPGAAT